MPVGMSLEEELLAIETRLWMEGPEAFRRHTDEQCLVVFPEGAGMMSREDIAKAAEKGRWKDVKMQKKGLRRLSDSAAVLSYECTAERRDGKAHHALVSSAYSHTPDGWKLAFHQQTTL